MESSSFFSLPEPALNKAFFDANRDFSRNATKITYIANPDGSNDQTCLKAEKPMNPGNVFFIDGLRLTLRCVSMSENYLETHEVEREVGGTRLYENKASTSQATISLERGEVN